MIISHNLEAGGQIFTLIERTIEIDTRVKNADRTDLPINRPPRALLACHGRRPPSVSGRMPIPMRSDGCGLRSAATSARRALVHRLSQAKFVSTRFPTVGGRCPGAQGRRYPSCSCGATATLTPSRWSGSAPRGRCTCRIAAWMRRPVGRPPEIPLTKATREALRSHWCSAGRCPAI
jgi:hypothetical protein